MVVELLKMIVKYALSSCIDAVRNVLDSVVFPCIDAQKPIQTYCIATAQLRAMPIWEFRIFSVSAFIEHFWQRRNMRWK